MELNEQIINSLLLPMNGFHIILPQSMVAEITHRPELTSAKDDSADWLQGFFLWRSEQVPLISFEGLCEMEDSRTRSSMRIAVIHALEEISSLVFYAFELRAIPHPLTLRHDSLQSARDNAGGCNYIAANALFGGHKAVIPDLKRIERKLSEQLNMSRQVEVRIAG